MSSGADQQNSGKRVQFSGEGAKTAYNNLTGSGVAVDGAGHESYRTGKNIDCAYTSENIEDASGKETPQFDPSRYSCIINIDSNGNISSAE